LAPKRFDNGVLLFPMKIFKHLFTLSLAVAASTLPAQTPARQAPPFDAVYRLLQENVRGLSADELNAAAVRGLLSELEGQATLLSDQPADSATGTNRVSSSAIYEKSYAYFRIGQVEEGLDDLLRKELDAIGATNKLKGVVLDLRFAEGNNYAAAAKTADLFVHTEQPLVNWGEGALSASPNTTAVSVPCAILINNRTRGAAEALAAALRESRAGLLIGSTTAGQASVFKEFPLPNNHTLRIASTPVKVGQDKLLGTNGVKADIELKVSLDDERAYLKDPYLILVDGVPHAPGSEVAPGDDRPRGRINEAELVRRKREGLSVDDDISSDRAPASAELQVIRDPALARAIDLLKGLALIQANRGQAD